MADEPVDERREALLQALARGGAQFIATQLGKLDIAFAPSGFPSGYEQLSRRATMLRVAQTSLTAAVAARDDVEHSKRVAARPKDRRYLQSVGRLQPPQPPQAGAR